SEDLRVKCKRALKAVVAKVTDASALAPLLRDGAPTVQKAVLRQYAALLPNDAPARKAFMQTGLLQRVQVSVAVAVLAVMVLCVMVALRGLLFVPSSVLEIWTWSMRSSLIGRHNDQ